MRVGNSVRVRCRWVGSPQKSMCIYWLTWWIVSNCRSESHPRYNVYNPHSPPLRQHQYQMHKPLHVQRLGMTGALYIKGITGLGWLHRRFKIPKKKGTVPHTILLWSEVETVSSTSKSFPLHNNQTRGRGLMHTRWKNQEPFLLG